MRLWFAWCPRSPVVVSEYKITTAWDQQIEPLILDSSKTIYELGWSTYPRNDVLNFRLENPLRFDYCGQMLEGTILAMGLQPLPATCTGARVPFQLMFADPFGHEIDATAEFYVERIAKKKIPAPPPLTGLYDPRSQKGDE